jgi:hypothetical protein
MSSIFRSVAVCVSMLALSAISHVSCQLWQLAPATWSPNYDGLLTKALFSDGVVREYGARCLDGSKAGIYYREGSTHNDDKYMIYLEGGAYCAGEADCIGRSQTALGSNLYWPDTMEPHAPSDILSANSTTNPHFHNWNIIYVPYCSGDLWLGNNTNPSPTSWNLTFAGNQIFLAAIQTLINDWDLEDATEVVLTGVSAGGIGVYYHLDRLADIMNHLTDYTARVVGAPQAGWFSVANSWETWLATPTLAYTPPVPDLATLYFVEVIVNYVPPPGCGSITSDVDRYTCTFYIPGYYPKVRTPTFIAENLFDAFQIFYANGVPNLLNATTQAYFDYYGAAMRASLNHYVVQSTSFWQWGNGLWAPACLEHELTYSGPVKVNNKTFQQAFVDWYLGKELFSSERYAIDSATGPTCFGNQ